MTVHFHDQHVFCPLPWSACFLSTSVISVFFVHFRDQRVFCPLPWSACFCPRAWSACYQWVTSRTSPAIDEWLPTSIISMISVWTTNRTYQTTPAVCCVQSISSSKLYMTTKTSPSRLRWLHMNYGSWEKSAWLRNYEFAQDGSAPALSWIVV